MEAEGVTRTIHENLKPLLHTITAKKLPISDLATLHCSKHHKTFKPACTSQNPSLLISTGRSGLFDAVYYSYFHHLPLSLTPDHLWITIMQGISTHVNNCEDRLKEKMVGKDGGGKVEIAVGTWSGKREEWAQAFRLFGTGIRERVVQGARKFTEVSFSTSDELSATASSIVLMDCFKAYFEYRLKIGCGIPSVTLKGSLDDWKLLRERTEEIITYVGMDFWAPCILPVLDEFISFYEGTTPVNVKFWDCIYKPMPALGSGLYWDDNVHQYHAGWIVNFFPYSRHGEPCRYEKTPVENQQPSKAMLPLSTLYTIHDKYLNTLNKETPREHLQEYFDSLGQGLKNLLVPTGVSQANFKIIDPVNSQETDALALAGLFGCCIEEGSGRVSPCLDWCVAERIGADEKNIG